MSNSLERRDDGSMALYIDGDLQFDSNDERTYHEALALPALALATRRLQSPLKVLVIGGGDGLIAREFFKSKAVIGLDLVDYDPEILNIARHDIADLNNKSLSDPRIIVHVKDAWTFVDTVLADNILYDVIVSDLTGAVDTAAARFHSIEWYSKLSQLLRHNGVLSVNALSAQRTPEAYWSIFNSLAKANLHARPYHVTIPSFVALEYGQDWGFFVASKEEIKIDELDNNLPLAEPRYYLKTIDDLHKLFDFAQEIIAYQPKSMPTLIDSNILLQYFYNPAIDTALSGVMVNSFTLDAASLVIPEPDSGKNILPQPIRSMLAESIYQAGAEDFSKDPQLLLKNILELMPSLHNEHTPELIADFLERPDTFLEAIDLPSLVGRLLKRASELPARLVAELELLRDKLQEWASDHNTLLLDMGQRVITILTLVVIVGNLLYPDAVYGKGEAAGHHNGTTGNHNATAARGYNRGGGWNNGTNPYYTNTYNRKLAPLNINEHNHVPAAPQTQNTGVRIKKGGAKKALGPVGFINDTEQVSKAQLSAAMRDSNALHNRLLKTKAEFVSYSETLTNELSQYNSTTETTVSFGSRYLPVAEAIRRTEASLKLLSSKIQQLDEQIAQIQSRMDLAKIAMANMTTEES